MNEQEGHSKGNIPRRTVVKVGGGAVLAMMMGIIPDSLEGFAQLQSDPPDRPHARCGWIEDLDPMTNPTGVITFQNNASFFNVIHPVFYTVDNPTLTLAATIQDPNHIIPAAAQAAGTAVWPMIAGPTDATRRDDLGQMLNDPVRRGEHVIALMNELQAPQLVPSNPVYLGFDINYEGLDNQYSQGFWDFLIELTNQAHALGKKISVAVGAIDTDGANRVDYPTNPYNYTKLRDIVDFIHIECYDFHHLTGDGSGHIGPVAPRGWVADVLQVVVNAGAAQKFIYGMPNYGLTAKVNSGDPDPTVQHGEGELTWGFGSLNQLNNACDPSTFKPTTDHMQPCPATPCCAYLNPGQNFDAGRQPNCQQAVDASTTLFFDDLASLEERLKSAHDQGLGGITYWTVGDELSGFFEMVQRYF